MGKEDRPDLMAKVGDERRDFLKKIAIAAAFAAPTVATFSVDGMRKKAFAQAAYDPPQVLTFENPASGQAVVTFNQQMNTGVGADASRNSVIPPCRTTEFENGGISYEWAWNGDTQVITFSGCQSYTYLNVTYNQGGCGSKFVGANGLELVPFSGRIGVDVPIDACT